MIDDIARVGCM